MELAAAAGWLTAVSASAAPQRDAERAGLEQHLCELAAIVEQCEDLVCVTDREGVIEYVNPAFERATGYARDEAVGAKPSLLKSGAHDSAFFAELWRALAAGRAFSARFENRRKDGVRYFEDKTITPVRDRSGAITHFVSTGKDVTEQVRAAGKLERAQRALAIMSECHRAVRTASSGDELLAHVCRVLIELGGYRAAWVALAGRDAAKSVRAAACAGIDSAEISALCAGWGDEAPGPVAAAIRTACTTVTGSVIAVPIPGEEESLGALVLGCGEAASPPEDEIALLEELAGQIGFDLDALRSRGLRRRAAELLEAVPRLG